MLQSLHKALPSTTLYYKACTQYCFCTTKLAHNTSQYYFVLQSLHKALPSTTLYYEACASTSQYNFVLHTWQSTSQYYFVLQSLHKESFYTQQVLSTERLLHTASFLDREAFTHRSFYAQQAFTQRSFYKQQAFTNSKRLHTEHFYTECFYPWQAFTHTHTEAFTQRRFCTQRSFYTQQAFTEKSFYRK